MRVHVATDKKKPEETPGGGKLQVECNLLLKYNLSPRQGPPENVLKRLKTGPFG